MYFRFFLAPRVSRILNVHNMMNIISFCITKKGFLAMMTILYDSGTAILNLGEHSLAMRESPGSVTADNTLRQQNNLYFSEQ